MPNFSAYKLILLTGAGFSKNFGGLLAREMWNRLILSPDIQRHARLRQLLGENFDYESIYQQVMHGNYTQDEKAAMQSAVVEAYSELDAQEIEASRHNEINWTAARQFIAAFSAQRGEKGFVFTVNQDLLVERFLGGENRPLLPGIPPQQVWFDPLSRQQ
ncbi:MAG: hypothetical protein HYU76_13545, partial [Betaproteobacteria bacterium]|nr:hypothetical protein [Betaproteobacteria bacterium]